MDYVDITGVWQNEFGSLMNIEAVDASSGIFSGIYSSSTGATGKYIFVGMTDVNPDPSVNSQTLSFSISWRDIGGDPTDAHWMSAFSGQLQIINGEKVITTTYLLQQDTDPSNNWGSTIIDKSTYVPYTGDIQEA